MIEIFNELAVGYDEPNVFPKEWTTSDPRYSVERSGTKIPGGVAGHHLIPTAKANESDLIRFLSAFGGTEYYDHDNFERNGQNLPLTDDGANATGLAKHTGNHNPYSEFVKSILENLQRELRDNLEAEVRKITDTGAFREEAINRIRSDGTADRLIRAAADDVQGLQHYLRDGLAPGARGNQIRHRFSLTSNDPNFTGDLNGQFGNVTLAEIRRDEAFIVGRAGSIDRTPYRADAVDANEQSLHATARAVLRNESFANAARASGAGDRTRLFNIFKNIDGSASAGAAGKLAIAAVAINAAVWVANQVDAGRSLEDIFADLKEVVGVDTLVAVGTSAIIGVIAVAAVGMVFGPVGVGLLIAVDAITSVDEFSSALDNLAKSMPEWDWLQDLLGASKKTLGSGEQFAQSRIKAFSVLEEHFKADFSRFNAAKNIRIVDGSLADEQGELKAKGTAAAADGNGGIDIIWGRNGAVVEGLSGNDLIYMNGYGRAYGGEGRDYLIAEDATYIKAGTIIDAQARATEKTARATYEAAYKTWADGGRVGDAPDAPEPDTTSARFADDQRLLLDGGAGNDFLFVGNKGSNGALLASGGTAAIAVGGAGNDTLFNYSKKGQMWGGGLDGRGASDNERDVFIASPGSFIMDAGKNDRLYFLDKPLLGGSNIQLWGKALEKGVARDWALNFVTYGQTESGQLLIDVSGNKDLNPNMSSDEILEVAQVVENWESGDLGIQFFIFGGDDQISLFKSLFRYIGAWGTAMKEWAKSLDWEPEDDPLVLDLNGDGLVSKGLGAAYFDQDGDYFAERTGWISGDDGFLVHDADGSGTIDDVSEMFGSPGVSGFAELLGWDTNGDGIVNAEDAGFAQLKVWRDRDGDALTDAGELYSLSQLGITALSVRPAQTNVTTANGTVIRAESFFAKSDGSTGKIGELIFESDRVSARYRGDRGAAAWVPAYDSVAIPTARISHSGDRLRAANDDDEMISQEAA